MSEGNVEIQITQEPNLDINNDMIESIINKFQNLPADVNILNLIQDLNQLQFIINQESTSQDYISKIFNILLNCLCNNTICSSTNLLFAPIKQILSNKSKASGIIIPWKKLYDTFYQSFLTHSKLFSKTYQESFIDDFIDVVLLCSNYFTEESSNEMEQLWGNNFDLKNPQFPIIYCLFCTFLPPSTSENLFMKIFEYYLMINNKSIDKISLDFFIRYLKVHPEQKFENDHIIKLFNKFVSNSNKDLSFHSEIDIFASSESNKARFSLLFVYLLKTNSKQIVLIHLQKLMKIIDLGYDNEFMDSLIYNFKQNIEDEETQKSFVQIVFPCFMHGLFTENFTSKNLSLLAEFSPQNVVASILETIENVKYKHNIVNSLIEINDVVAKFNVETEDYYLAVLSLVDEISSIEEDLTELIYKLYAKFTSVFPMDESLTDWINSVFTKSIEISQVSVLDKIIQSNMRQTLINVFSNADAEMIWSLLEVFRENMDQILCENIGPFVDAFPITTFIDFCFNDEQKVNYFIIHRLLKNSGLYLDDKIITMIKSSICSADQSIRKIGTSIVKQTLSNICVFFPHYMPKMKKPQINKPSNDKEKIRLIHETVLKTVKQNFNGKDYQYQVDILNNLKVLLSFDLENDLAIEILNYLSSLPILTLHSAVLSRIIECFAVLFEYKKKNYYQPNIYEKTKLEIINYQNIHKKVSSQISEMIYNYILEIPAKSLKQNVVDSILQFLNCASQIDITFQSHFSKFVEKFKENNDIQFYRILSVFVNNCDINSQFNILDDLIQYVCKSDNDFKDVKDHLISYLDSIDFYSPTLDSNEINEQRKELVGKIIDISIEKNNTDTTSFVISCINSLVDGNHAVLTQKLFKFVLENLTNEDKAIRQTSIEIISKATEYLIPRSSAENYEFNDKRLVGRKKVSVKMSNDDKNSEEFLKKYFNDDIEERLKISQTMNEFLDNINHCLELIVSDEGNIFSLQNFKFFATFMRYYNSKFTEIVFEIDEHLLDSKSYNVISFVNESISAFIVTYHYTNDEQNLQKLFNFIQSKPELLFIPSSLVSTKDSKRYEFLTNHIQSINVDDDIIIFSLPFAFNDEKLRNFIISKTDSPQILAELSCLDPESIYNRVSNSSPLNFSVYLSSIFNEQSLSTISITKIVNSNVNQIFGMILDEKTDDEIIENFTNAFKSMSFNIDQTFSFNFQQVDEKWLILISELEIIEALFENAAFYVDEHSSDIILDFIVPSMLMTAHEIAGSAQRLLTNAFERFYSLQENSDIFVGVFTKMAQEDSVSGLNGLMCIVSGTPLFGTVPQHIADALTVLNDYSSANHQISEFLNLFWSKYEGTFVPSASLCLSPIRKSLKSHL